MQSLINWKPHLCPHTEMKDAQGLALITIGNSLRGHGGVAAALCDVLPDSTLENVCRLDLGTHTNLLARCLSGHSAAIIVDSTCNGTATGTVTILDLGAVMDRATPLNIQSCHGFSLADALRLAKRSGSLPKRLIFFGVEVDSVDWDNGLSTIVEEKLHRLVKNLSQLVSRVLETLKQDA